MNEEPRYLLSDIKAVIWRKVLTDPNVQLKELQNALHAHNMKMSPQTLGSLAAEFRQVFKFLRKEGLINERRLQARQRTAPASKLSGDVGCAHGKYQRATPRASLPSPSSPRTFFPTPPREPKPRKEKDPMRRRPFRAWNFRD